MDRNQVKGEGQFDRMEFTMQSTSEFEAWKRVFPWPLPSDMVLAYRFENRPVNGKPVPVLVVEPVLKPVATEEDKEILRNIAFAKAENRAKILDFIRSLSWPDAAKPVAAVDANRDVTVSDPAPSPQPSSPTITPEQAAKREEFSKLSDVDLITKAAEMGLSGPPFVQGKKFNRAVAISKMVEKALAK